MAELLRERIGDERGALSRLSERSGVSFSYLRSLSIGYRTDPTLSTLFALADALGCHARDLVPDRFEPAAGDAS